MSAALPYPPSDLVRWVGASVTADPVAEYERVGAHCRDVVRALLPDDWSFEARRVLDFGCGAGRVIRHFAAEAERASFVGCDLHDPSVAWAQEHLTPPFEFFTNAELPPLPQPAASFDLVYGMSVFTHLSDSWSRWLQEIHRLLKPGGYAVLTFLGEHMADPFGVEWDEERIGMLDFNVDNPWVHGGPTIMHSPWWILAHWGRAFEVLKLVPSTLAVTSALDGRPGASQGVALLRRDHRPTPDLEELERPESGDVREVAALHHNVGRLKDEIRSWRRRALGAEADRDRLAETVHVMQGSKSWRLTAPPRRWREALRRR